MSFLLYCKVMDQNVFFYEDKNRIISWQDGAVLFMGRGHGWGKPSKGWTINADDLLVTYADQHQSINCNGSTHALVIDFHPDSIERIALLELDRIHLYTYVYEDGYVDWTPMMLELRDLYYDDNLEEFTADYKESIMQKMKVTPDRGQIVEFLYLKGNDYCNSKRTL